MAYGILFEFTDEVGKKHYDAVNAKLGVDMAGGSGPFPAGLRSHAGGASADGFFVIEVWDSKGEQEQWMAERLGPALAEVGVPAPIRLVELDLVGFATP
jgi:hypothetical protein